MLKRLVVVCFAFLFITLTYVSTSKLFVYEKAFVVYGGKSLGKIVSEKVMPFTSSDGVFKVFSKDTNYKDLVKKYNAKLVFIEKNGDIVSEYYYSNSLPSKEIINGKKVNLYIAISLEQIVIGSPIIYGSY